MQVSQSSGYLRVRLMRLSMCAYLMRLSMCASHASQSCVSSSCVSVLVCLGLCVAVNVRLV